MQIGLIGLGKMGGNMAERLRAGGHEVIGYDRDPEARPGPSHRSRNSSPRSTRPGRSG